MNENKSIKRRDLIHRYINEMHLMNCIELYEWNKLQRMKWKDQDALKLTILIKIHDPFENPYTKCKA